MTADPLLDIRGASRVFGGGRTLLGTRLPAVYAIQNVSLEVMEGETLGIVGESGCGKSTLARMVVGLDTPTSGTIVFDGEDIAAYGGGNPRALAQRVQYVFQDPIASLNPRKTIRAILEAPLRLLLNMGATDRARRLDELVEAVNLSPDFLDRYPHEFSGGQAQRIGIARALAANPKLIVLDEPVSALDVSVQAQVLNLLDELKQRYRLTYIFISHDLSVVESVSDRVTVLYFGRIAESAPAENLFAAPLHPYTKLLLESAPAPGRRSLAADDANTELPDPYDPPPGCAFAARCPRASDICVQIHPALEAAPNRPSHFAACYHPHERG